MKNLGMAYSIKKRNMAKGGMACAHGGPAYCNAGCYDQGGEVKNSADSLEKGLDYEEMADEKQSESNNYPQRPLMPEISGDNASMKARSKGLNYEVDTDEVEDEENNMPAMAHGGMMHPKNMAKMAMRMAKGGMINSMGAHKKAEDYQMAQEDQMAPSQKNEDVDIKMTTPHDDFLSDEEEDDMDMREGATEGKQIKMRRKSGAVGGLLDRVMSRVGRA